ncbi:DUF5301 domain-containing protein [Bacillus altitudinis]|uniref:DUF5301 domain-containing protein n=1 Tax=Bacillus altitudinis TaxID=293387 RepID=UPI00064EBEF5|nr:DUF5301 domain-containing protein [Bacillus altitudinis]KMK99167.1 hypothetical protein VL05_18100 [Bacillus stratosphericus]MBY0187313.1 DUF5301 domain-containing protein [Bacillus aerophilus]KML59376.1 hypothetical protein VL17_00385 [Bacillus stratosphericus]MCY7532352.1 DUF5301 domain-containing protein [Bacillus altitudinis]MDI6648834.1 DUF5301 domain-containing protein [Bacillus altitudinis]
MKKWIIGLVVVIFIGIGLYFMINAKTYAFDDVVSIDKDKVTSIQIEHDDERVVVDKKEDIQKLLKKFSGIQLKKLTGSKKETKESYWIRVYENQKQMYGLTLYDQSYLETYDGSKTKNRISEYQIVDANQVDMGQYIK